MALKCLILCISTLLISTHGRPEAPLPYYYSAPSIDQNSITKPRISQTYIPGGQQNLIPPTSSYGTPILRTSNVLPAPIRNNYDSSDLQYSNQSPLGLYANQPVSVQKHIYVHVAPPDAEEQRIQGIQQQALRQKHYKIIFVKVPSFPAPAQYVAQQQALKEEKTLIYVLVKKPEEPSALQANHVASAPVNKPEVYFIKYKAKSEHAATGGGQNVVQQGEGVQENNDNDSVVVESPFRGAKTQGQAGYSYDRPTNVLK